MKIIYRLGSQTWPVGHTDRIFTENDVGKPVELDITLKHDKGVPKLRMVQVESVDPTKDCVCVIRA